MAIAIGYLGESGRFFNFGHFCNTMKQIRYKEEFHVLVLVQEPHMIPHFTKVIEDSGLQNATVHLVPQQDNYMHKICTLISFAEQNGHEYAIKLDNDILFHPSILDYMYENRERINDTGKLTLSPNLSTGIPTCENFMKDFFTEAEQTEMTEMFKNHEFGSVWGQDYSFLNYPKSEWDPKVFHDTMNASPIFYKGIHPVRVNNEIMKRYNEIVSSHASEFRKSHEYTTYEFENDSYMCNSFFMIKTDTYKKIVTDPSLFVDGFEEVALNKYCVRENMKKLYIGNSFTIHPWYNSYPEYLQAEYALFGVITGC
jgi:hypothetical protein